MKKYFLLISILLVSYDLVGQAPTIQWQKCLGGSGRDSATSAKKTFDGGFIIAGISNSTNGNITGNHGGTDAWILKLDSSGNILWTKCFGGSLEDGANWIEQTKDSGYIICGYTNSNDGDFNGSKGQIDGWVIKLNSAGNIIWKHRYGGSYEDRINCIKQINDSNYIFIGSTASYNYDLAGYIPNSFIIYQHQWIAKINSIGNILWQKVTKYDTICCFNAYSGINGDKIIETKTKDYIYTNQWSNRVGNANAIFSGYQNCIKIDSTGNKLWNLYGLNGGNRNWANSRESDIKEFNDSCVLFVTANALFITPYDVNFRHFNIGKINKTGNWVWRKSYYTDSTFNVDVADAPTSALILNENQVLVAGHSKGKYCKNCDLTGSLPTNNHGNYDCWVMRVDSTGELIWQNSYGGSNNDYTTEIFTLNNTEVVIVGTTQSNNGDVNSNHGNSDIWLCKLTTSILPLKILSFAIKKENKNVLLSWKTLNEINVSHFNIQRSINVKEFSTIGEMDPQKSNIYSFIDQNYVSESAVYYRLEIVDKDGTKTYSNIQSINNRLTNANNIIFPNPSKGQIKIVGNFKNLRITDNIGKIIIAKQLDILQKQTTIDISQLTKGIYYIQCINNEKATTEKLIVE